MSMWVHPFGNEQSLRPSSGHSHTPEGSPEEAPAAQGGHPGP